MRRTFWVCMALTAVLVAACPVFGATKTVTLSLPADWAADVSYPVVKGYRAIVGNELVPCSPMNAVGDPDLPFLRVNINLPEGSTFVGVAATAEWTPVDLGGLWPLPIVQPVPTGSDPVVSAPSAAYDGLWPKDIAVAQPLQILNRVKIVPVNVTPFRWDGATKTLYRATSLRVDASFAVQPRLKLSTSSLKLPTSGLKPSTVYYGNDQAADFIIVSPPAFLALWKKYADFRVTTENGKDHVFAIKSTAAIYEEYADVGGDDAFKIHRYIEDLYRVGNIKYVLLGSAPKKYEYDPETMVPSRYIVVGSSLGQVSDEYYGCMHRNPLDASGNEQGVEVWDYDGDGAYMGHKNANGSYSCDSSDKIDWTQEIVVFRFPLMREVVETRGSGASFERKVLTDAEIMDNFIAKIKRIEGVNCESPCRYGASLSGSTGFASSTLSNPSRPELRGPVWEERQFFDGGRNMFDPAHNPWSSDSEIVPRDRGWEFLSYLRGNNDDEVVLYNSSESKGTYSDMYDHSGDVFHILAHGWARGCAPGSGTEAFFSTGYYTTYCCPIPCDSGMMDYCPSGSYGITNCICFGEAPILAPHGGSLASFNNTRLGWSATFATSYNHGNGQHSHRMDWLILRTMSGVQTGKTMDAGNALMFAKNNFNAGYYASAAWGLSGLEVTGQGDPLARFSPQFSRVWRPDAANGNWNRTDKNWSIPEKNDTYAADYSTDIFANLAGKGDFTFNIQTNLSSAGFFVKQDADATLTIAGDAKYRVTRETVVTNGNLRWEAAGGAGRYGVKFVGARGDIELPGDKPRYFGERFSNVGNIRVTGGNVVIDTPRDAIFGKDASVDFMSLAFVGAGDFATNNFFRTRKAGFLPADFTIPVVNSELTLQVVDNPKIAASNATVRVQANPLYENCYFAREIRLHDATLVGDYVNFALGPQSGSGFDLYVSGKCAISGTVPIRLNGDLRVHFEGEDSELEIMNSLADGTVKGSVTFIGSGKVRITGAQTFSWKLSVQDGVEVVCEVADAIASSIEVTSGGDLMLAKIPLVGLANLTIRPFGRLHLPEPTYIGTYKIVDATTTTLDIQEDAKVYDASGEEITGEQTQGHFVLAANQLIWKNSGGMWDLDPANEIWETAAGFSSAYDDNSPLKFDDLDGDDVTVLVGTNVAPGFVDFRNVLGRYFFTAAAGVSPTITLNSLVATAPVTFDVPLDVPGGIMATGGSVQFGDVVTPKIEIADGGFVRATGRVDIPSQKVKKLKFVFSGTRGDGERAAICELRIFNDGGFFYLPEGTVVRDIAGDEITITGNDGKKGHAMTGSVGDERLSALVDGKVEGGNKWWASKSTSPTWFEITFPEPVERITGYSIASADQQKRDPKDWQVYATDADDGRYSLVASETGRTWGPRRDWMKYSPQTDRFPIGTMSGLALVRAGGRLILDGTWCADLDLGADAVLVVTNTRALAADSDSNRLLLPDSGMVTIDLSMASRSAAAFPILMGYRVTAEQFGKFACVQEDAMLLLQDGDICAATDNVMTPPYTADVSGAMNWSDVLFSASDGTSFKWGEANVKADGAVTLDVTGNAALTMDAVGTVASLTVTGSGTLTVVAKDGVTPLAPAVLDDSAHTGALVWELPIGSTAVKAGADTTINGGSVGTGRLTVGAGKKATLGAGVTFANRAIDPAGWVRFAGTREGFVLADWPAATYSFENGTLAGMFTLDGHTIRSAAGDYVKLVGTNDNYFARSLLNFDISGGTVEIASNGETTWFGRTGTTGGKAATKFKMTGGTFRCLANGTGTGGGLLVGYEGGDEAGNEIALDISGGTLEVPDSCLNFGTPTVVNLTGTGRIRAKGFTSSIASGVINLGTGNNDTSRIEVGSLGFRPGSATVTMHPNTAIVGFEAGASLAEAVTLYGSGRKVLDDEMTVAATNGATLALRDMKFGFYLEYNGEIYNGNEPVTFGNLAKDYTGEVVLESASAFPKRWRIAAGSVNVGAIRVQMASKLVERPTNGKVVVVLTEEEYASGASCEILYCDAWANGLSSDELRQFITVKVDYGQGEVVEDTTGTLRCASGVVEFLPVGAAGYLFPISATVAKDANWTALDWHDRNGVKYTNDWTGVISAELVCNGPYTVTMDRPISMKRLTTRVSSAGMLTLNAGESAALSLTDRLDDSASAGTTQLHITLGAGMTVAAGKALLIDGAKDTAAAHGKLIIGANSQVTVLDGYWNGEVEMADATASLYYMSYDSLTTVPSALNGKSVGTVLYSAPITAASGKAEFGSTTSRAVDGTFKFNDGTALVVDDFTTGLGNGSSQTFFIQGGEVAVGDSIVLSADTGSKTAFYLTGGTLDAPDAVMVLGKQGKATMTVKNGTCRIGGITTDGVDNNSGLTLVMCGMEIGAGGISIDSSIHKENVQYYPITMQSGTLVSTHDADIAVPNGIGVYVGVTFAPAVNTTLSVHAPLERYWMTRTSQTGACSLTVNGEGRVTLYERSDLAGTTTTATGYTYLKSGTLRLARRGLLGVSRVQFNGGKMEVLLTQNEAVQANGYPLFMTTANASTVASNTKVLVAETGSEVPGSFSVSGNGVYFKPTAVTGIAADIKTNTDCDWSAVPWKYAGGGDVPASVWNQVVGAATLKNSATTRLAFSQACTISTLTINNSGDLAVDGPGTMTVTTLDDSASTGTTRIGSCFVTTDAKAGASTVFELAGSGTLTIGQGKRATIPGWSNIASVSGAGTVSIDMGEKDAAVLWNSASGVLGTNEIVCGTWTHTTTATYPRNREVSIRGTNAVLRFMSSTDITGYGGYSQALTIADGATWLVDVRDTFSRPLCLVNGGRVLLKQDSNGNDGRMLDMFSGSAKICVRGPEPSVIGGQAADITSTANSGIIAIGRTDFTVDVDGGSTLKVYSRWDTRDKSGGSFIKVGAGTMEQHRASSCGLPFVISAGTLRLVGNGSVTKAGMTNNGTLELCIPDGNTRTFTTDVAGKGAFVKSGAGTLGFGTRRPAYAIALTEGKLSFALTADEKSTDDWIRLCTLADAAQFAQERIVVYDIDGKTLANVSGMKLVGSDVYVKVDAYRMPISLTVTSAQTKDWVGADWEDANHVHIPSAAWEGLLANPKLELAIAAHQSLVLNVNTNVAATRLTVSGTGGVRFNFVGGHTLTVPLCGDGTVVSESAWPNFAGVTDAETWHGCVKITGTVAMSGTDFAAFGNENSSIEIAGTVNGGHLLRHGSCASALCVSGTFHINNGYSRDDNGYTFSGKLTGEGAIKASGKPTDITHFTGDVSGFAGMVQTTYTNGQCIAFGELADDDKNVGRIVVNNTTAKIAPGEAWSAANGLRVMDEAKLTLTPGATTPIAGDATFDSGATLNVLTDGTSERYTIATGALLIGSTATLQFNGVDADWTYWKAEGGDLVLKPAEVTASPEGAPITAVCNGRKLVVNGVAGGFVVVNSVVSPVLVTAQGDPLVLRYSGDGMLQPAGGFVANADVAIDASGLDGMNIAKYAVSGAPYSRWLVMGSVSGPGAVTVDKLPAVPKGYEVVPEVLPAYGVRLVVKANVAARFGSVNLNFAGGRNTVWDNVASHVSDNVCSNQFHGAHPVIGSSWNDMSCQSGTRPAAKVVEHDQTVGATNAVSVTLSGINNPYTTGRNASPRILFGYADDGKNPKVEISGIPFAKYRVIAYRSTDTTGTIFSSVKIGTSEADALYYNGPTANVEQVGWTVPNAAQVAWGDSDANTLGEGVNYVVSDVLEGTPGKATAYVSSQKHAGRAGVAAIQIVEVGEVYTGPLEYEEKTLATKLSYVLPGTVTTQAFDYVYHPTGADDHDWATAANWATVEIRQTKTGAIVTNYTAYSGSVAPALPDGAFVPVVFDGHTVTGEVVEGWVAQYGLYHGADVTINHLKKFQRGNTAVQMFVAVDETSRFTVRDWWTSGNSDANVNFHVAAPSGIVFKVNYNRSTAVNYYLAGAGSVVYEHGFSGTHSLKSATIELGDAAFTNKTVVKKHLVIGGTVTSGELVVSGGMRKASDAALAADDAVGTYRIGGDAVGTYVEWMARASGEVVVDPSETGVVIPATSTNDVKIVSVWTNDMGEAKLDLTPAYTLTKVLGGVTAELNSNGRIVVGTETIAVRPELSRSDEEIEPLTVDGDVSVGVKTIPGLTYYLMRGSVPGTYPDNPASERAKGPRTQLTDKTISKPDRAFYIIRVGN